MNGTKDIVLPKFYPKQLAFLEAKGARNCYGGAAGGGKSFVARWLLILQAYKYAGINILMLRRTFPELSENHIKQLIQILNCKNPSKSERLAEYKADQKVFIFPNGSRIKMGYCKNEDDVYQYQGQEYDVIFMEEATQFTETQYIYLTSRNRLSSEKMKEYGFKPRMYFTCNPGGVGHAWVKRLFIDREYTPTENPEDYTMIYAQVTDNKFIMENNKDYVNNLMNLPEDQKKALLYGDWDVFSGRFFTEFSIETHVIEAFPIPKGWRIYRTRDYGLDRTAVLWIARDFEGNSYVYREFGESNLVVSEAGKKINELTEKWEDIYMDIAPPDLYNKNSQTGRSAADIFREKCGHYLTKASNDRVQGWLTMKEMFKLESINGEEPKPKLFIFKNCTELIKCIPLLRFDESNPNDVAKEPHNITHMPDALRYYCISWTYEPIENPSKKNRKDTLPFELRDDDTEEDKYISWD